MAESTDHVGIISILPARHRPPARAHYGSADNIFVVAESKWNVWNYVEEIILNCDDDELITDDDIWIVSWDVTWDLDAVIDEYESGLVDEMGREEMFEHTLWEMLEMVSEDISYSNEWLGDTTLESNTEENIERIAREVTAMCTQELFELYVSSIANPVMLPYIEWRCDLYGGRWRTVV